MNKDINKTRFSKFIHWLQNQGRISRSMPHSFQGSALQLEQIDNQCNLSWSACVELFFSFIRFLYKKHILAYLEGLGRILVYNNIKPWYECLKIQVLLSLYCLSLCLILFFAKNTFLIILRSVSWYLRKKMHSLYSLISIAVFCSQLSHTGVKVYMESSIVLCEGISN